VLADKKQTAAILQQSVFRDRDCKPGSVIDSHLSRRTVANTLKPPKGRPGKPMSHYGVAPNRVYRTARFYTAVGELLPRLSTLTFQLKAVYLCCTFPEVAFGGRYPLSLPCGARTFLTDDLSVLSARLSIPVETLYIICPSMSILLKIPYNEDIMNLYAKNVYVWEVYMTLKQYAMSLSDKRLAIVGIGVSNTPLIKILLGYGVSVLACDKKERHELEGLAEELEALGAELCLGKNYLDSLDADIIFRTPGMHPYNPALIKARENGAEITSEMEVFFKLCPCKIIAVTGSDGKTTTTTLISEILKKAGHNVYVGGNIGNPLLPVVDSMTENDIAVLELSSFQLMTMVQSPDVSVITNLAPNHLDVHSSMDEYVHAKENIYLHQSNEGRLILNLDNEITRSFAPNAKGFVEYFSRQKMPENGAYFDGETLFRVENGKSTEIVKATDIRIPGLHNVENYMAAICATFDFVQPHHIAEVAKEFGGVEGRLELCRIKDEVRFFNDSMASSPSRTIADLRSFSEKVILIAGGYDKNIPYDDLGPVVLEHVKKLVLTGATAEKIRIAVESAPGFDSNLLEIVMEPDFTLAVQKAAAMAMPGDTVILSPASASFDRFKNFVERGRFFKKVVNEL